MSLWKIYLLDHNNGAYLVHECKRNAKRKAAVLDYGNKSAKVIKCFACDNRKIPKRILEALEITKKITRG